jgi:hypothetical protein
MHLLGLNAEAKFVKNGSRTSANTAQTAHAQMLAPLALRLRYDDKQNVASLHFAYRARGWRPVTVFVAKRHFACHGVNKMPSVNSVHVRHFVYPEPVICSVRAGKGEFDET